MNLWYLLDWNLGQQVDLGKQRDEIDQLKRRLRARPVGATTESEVERLRVENGELRLYVATLFRLLITKGVATEDEVRSLVRVIDGGDGQVDNAFRGDVLTGKGGVQSTRAIGME